MKSINQNLSINVLVHINLVTVYLCWVKGLRLLASFCTENINIQKKRITNLLMFL